MFLLSGHEYTNMPPWADSTCYAVLPATPPPPPPTMFSPNGASLSVHRTPGRNWVLHPLSVEACPDISSSGCSLFTGFTWSAEHMNWVVWEHIPPPRQPPYTTIFKFTGSTLFWGSAPNCDQDLFIVLNWQLRLTWRIDATSVAQLKCCAGSKCWSFSSTRWPRL